MERNATVDVARGVGIIAVVLGHNWVLCQDDSELFRVVYSFHMPLFFFLTGVFLNESASLYRFVRSRAASLLKPYFSVLLLMCLCRISLELVITDAESRINLDYLLGIFYATGATIEWPQLWFLPHLFASSLFALGIVKLIGRHSVKTGLLVSSLLLIVGLGILEILNNIRYLQIGLFKVGADHGLPWSVDLIFITSSFILVGYFLKDKVVNMKLNRILLIVSITLFVDLHLLFEETIDFNFRIYGDFLVSTIQAYTGIYILLSFSVMLRHVEICGKVLSYLGSGSLVILIFHYGIQKSALIALAAHIQSPPIRGGLSFALAMLMPLVVLAVAQRSAIVSAFLLPRQNDHRRHGCLPFK